MKDFVVGLVVVSYGKVGECMLDVVVGIFGLLLGVEVVIILM